MSILRKSNKKASARTQVNIKGVRDGVLILPHHQYRMILEASAVNFELKSSDEQDALIDTYESFLNSLASPIQIIVRTRELDIDKYLNNFKTRLEGEEEEIYRTQIENYSTFIKKLVKNNHILSRRFYVVIPYFSKDGDFAAVKEQLAFLTSLVNKGLEGMGMQTRRLTGLEMLDLFYSFYNPSKAKRQPITNKALHLLNSMYTQGVKR